MDEFLDADSLENKTEEASDILEVLECLLATYSVFMSIVLSKKAEKSVSSGSFKKGLYWNES